MARIVIIIPTYNECKTTAELIGCLASVVESVENHDLHVLYVDGNSPDGTADLVRKKQQLYPWLHLLVEEGKAGLGIAYARGMKHAMTQLSADYLMEFDGDFQHRPADIHRLVAEIDNGFDYIIGSRYVRRGEISKEWGVGRRLLSWGGNLFARIVLVLPRVHDVTGGFKLSRVKGFMDAFDFDTLLSSSFAYKIHLLYYMVKHGARVKEVPITFEPRTAGVSKIPSGEMKETLRVIMRLRFSQIS